MDIKGIMYNADYDKELGGAMVDAVFEIEDKYNLTVDEVLDVMQIIVKHLVMTGGMQIQM